MKKLVIATAVGALLSSTLLVAAPNAVAQTAASSAKTTTATTKKAKAKRPAPRHALPRSKKARAVEAAKVDPVPPGAEHWSCKDGLSYDLAGDLARDQIVTVHWAERNYQLPRQVTTTGADAFYDPASGLKLVVIPTKGMLFSDKDDSRLADECQTAAMQGGALAPTQAQALKPAN
jgi:hypothetical protein